jgi:hypothetical protein
MFCVTLLRRHDHDKWFNTAISPNGGSISAPPVVSSWIASDVISYLLENRTKMTNCLSETQREKIIETALRNDEFKSIRIFEADDNMRRS